MSKQFQFKLVLLGTLMHTFELECATQQTNYRRIRGWKVQVMHLTRYRLRVLKQPQSCSPICQGPIR